MTQRCPVCEGLWDEWHGDGLGCPYEDTTRVAIAQLNNAMADAGEVLRQEFEGLARSIGLFTLLDTAELFLRWIDLGTPPRDALYQALFRYWLERHA